MSHLKRADLGELEVHTTHYKLDVLQRVYLH